MLVRRYGPTQEIPVGIITVMLTKGRKYLLTALTGKAIADLICCSDNIEYDFITSTLRERNIGFQLLTEEDTIKLLIAGQVKPYGVYLTTGDQSKDTLLYLQAKAYYLQLANYFGIIRVTNPVGLDANMLKERPVLVTANS